MTGLAAIILAGGRSQRMGQDKASLLWAGQTAVARLSAMASVAGAETVIVAGADHGLPHTRDPVAFGGPVGGLLAAADALSGAGRLLVLAVDAPTVTVGDLAPLLGAPGPGAAYAGLPLPMVVAYDALPRGLATNASLRRFVAEAGLTELPVPAGALVRLRGANTPEELWALRRSAATLEAAR